MATDLFVQQLGAGSRTPSVTCCAGWILIHRSGVDAQTFVNSHCVIFLTKIATAIIGETLLIKSRFSKGVIFGENPFCISRSSRAFSLGNNVRKTNISLVYCL